MRQKYRSRHETEIQAQEGDRNTGPGRRYKCRPRNEIKIQAKEGDRNTGPGMSYSDMHGQFSQKALQCIGKEAW